MKRTRRSKKKQPAWVLELYIADTMPRSLLAMANLRNLCEQYLGDAYEIRIIDIVREPDLAIRNDVLAVPTLVRTLPAPQKKMIGSLSDMAAVLRGLDLGRGSEQDRARPSAPLVFLQQTGAA